MKTTLPIHNPTGGGTGKNVRYRADFLWTHEEGSVEEAGYEFANAGTEEYRKLWWDELRQRIAARAMDRLRKKLKRMKVSAYSTQEEAANFAIEDVETFINRKSPATQSTREENKMSQKLTKGPWKVSYIHRRTRTRDNLSFITAGDSTVAKCDGDDAIANAKLIAAAPDMLEALKKAISCASIPNAIQDIIRAAISKATAETR